MESMDVKREQFQGQIRELYRLAEEAEACARLLRQQATKHQNLLDSDDLTEDQLDELISEKPEQTFEPPNASATFRPAEGLM